MRVIVQRVKQSSVTIDNQIKSAIGIGLMILVGIGDDDNKEAIDYIVKKVVNLRVFDDADGVMHRSVLDIQGDILLVSQFTLMASTKKGCRPSYIRAARPEVSIPIYESLINTLEANLGRPIGTGEFGADMKVELVNDGPVTIIIDSKQKDY